MCVCQFSLSYTLAQRAEIVSENRIVLVAITVVERMSYQNKIVYGEFRDLGSTMRHLCYYERFWATSFKVINRW